MWAIITNNGAFEFDSLLELDIIDESTVIDEPIEKGSFTNYNKVESALRVRISLGFNGDEAAFNVRWDELKERKKSLDVVGIVAGQVYIENMTFETLRWSRQADVGYYVVDITLIEVREVETQTTTTEYTRPKTKSSNSTGTVDEGNKEGDNRSGAAVLTDVLIDGIRTVAGGGWGDGNAAN